MCPLLCSAAGRWVVTALYSSTARSTSIKGLYSPHLVVLRLSAGVVGWSWLWVPFRASLGGWSHEGRNDRLVSAPWADL